MVFLCLKLIDYQKINYSLGFNILYIPLKKLINYNNEQWNSKVL